MSRRRTFTDATVVVAARDLFWERGYTATSLTQLQQVTGLSKSSLYETYGSKRGLFERAIQSYLDDTMAPLLSPLEAPGAGQQDLVDYFHGLARLIHSAPPHAPNRGCLMLNTSVELDELDDGVTLRVGAYRNRVQSAIRQALAAIGSVTDPDTRSTMLLSNQLGLLALARLDAGAAVGVAGTVAAEVASW